MKNKKYYWKVVCINHKNEYTSAIIRKGRYKAIYKVGEFIKSPMIENGLLVFSTREQARRFKRDINGGAMPTIFKVDVRGEEITNPTFYNLDYLEDGRLVIPYYKCIFPLGTRCFPEVKLVAKCR